MEDGSSWPSPAGPLLSKLADIFVQVIAYTHVTRQEALDIIGFMLSNHSSRVHEQLLSSFIQHELLQRIPSTAYYRIVNTQVSGILTPLSQCYSPTCNIRDLCYSPTCPNSKSECDLFTSTNSWLQRIPKHILQKTHRNELLRQAAIADLLSMEQSYLADLHILDEVYSKPLLSSPCVPESYRNSFHMLLFGNYQLLSKLHHRFCIELVQHCQNPNQILFGKVGSTIQQHIQNLIHPYIQYTGNHIRSSYALRMERRRNPSFCRFVDSQNGQPRTRRLSLGHFLSAPTLWIGKYRMLVEALAKRSSELPEDKVVLQQCVISLQDLLSKMNQAATDAGHDTRRAHVTACLALSIPSYYSLLTDTTAGWSHQWIFPYDAKLLHEGKMWLQRSTASPLPTTTMIQCHAFLFDHMLFIAQAAKMIDGMEEYTLVGKPIPLAAFVWMDDEQYNHYSSSSPLIHRLSRQLSSKLSVKPSTIWSTIRRTPSTTFQSPPPIDTLSSSKSTPVISPQMSPLPAHQSLGSASRLRRRLRTNRWSSGPVYTHSSSAIHTLTLPSPDQQLNRRQSVPELSFYNNTTESNINHAKTNGQNTISGKKKISISPLTPIESGKRSSSSYSSTTTTTSSSSSSTSSQTAIHDTTSSTIARETIPPLGQGDNKSKCIQFAHSASIETPYMLEFEDTQSCQLWRDAINSALSLVHPQYSLSPIWEQSSRMSPKKLAQAQQRDEASSFKRLSSSPWSSISTSATSPPVPSSSTVTPRRKSDPEEDLHHMQIHCAFPYRTSNGDKMIALGTQNGVWVGSEHQLTGTDTVKDDFGLTQIIPTHPCHRLVMINGMLVAMTCNPKHKYSLVAYPILDSNVGGGEENQRQQGKKQEASSSEKKWCVVKRDWVISMAVGRLYQQTVLVYLTRYGAHVLAVVAIPRTHAPWFRKVKEYTVRMKDANNISIHNNALYIQSNKYGVESIVPSRKRETSVHWQNISRSPCIAYIPLLTGHGLATSSGIWRINLPSSSTSSVLQSSTLYTSNNGTATTTTTSTSNDPTQKNNVPLFEFESRMSSISMDYPFVIAFGHSLIEIWNVELNKLVQVFHSPYLGLLYDSDQAMIDNKQDQQQQQSKNRTILVGHSISTSSSWDKNYKSIPVRIYRLTTTHQASDI
ncbi:hypothetical protein BCR42DRAFT_468053 [Absidia repens]|uniref:DH domain-containing protein n=1 Tax=Absidia repens TaxID=90262 RepID=A0A1X2I9K3_9FUNG|nr:hypothetical protein BCR42DRAFT_468053 [Absidia repens]